MLMNIERPYTCEECGAELSKLLMQHMPKRTIILGACVTVGCTKRHSHQAAECISADERTRAAIEAISQTRNVAIGTLEYAYAAELGEGHDVNLKAAVRIMNDERDAIGTAAGMNNKDAARVIAAEHLYVANPHKHGITLIEAIMNWLVATGRAEGEGMIE